MSTTPPSTSTWSKEVDKLKNRLSVLSQSSLEVEDQEKLKGIKTNDPELPGKDERTPSPGMYRNERTMNVGSTSSSCSSSSGTTRRPISQPRPRESGDQHRRVKSEVFEESEFVTAKRREEEEVNGGVTYDFFFYGTLMHPLILTRVLGRVDPGVEFQDAILLGYVRHGVRSADYPAIINSLESSRLLRRPLSVEEASVRGTYVRGLRRVDVLALDAFEGEEYARTKIRTSEASPSPFVSPPILTPSSDLLFVAETPPPFTPSSQPSDLPETGEPRPRSTSSPYFSDVPVRPVILTLSESKSMDSFKRDFDAGAASTTTTTTTTLSPSSMGKPDVTVDRVRQGVRQGERGFGEVEAWVYVWRDDVGKLERDIWDFRSFLDERSHRWTGVSPVSTADPSSSGSLLRATDVNTAARRDEDEYKAVDELREKLRTGVVI